jgi:hypothetical protein
MIKLKGMFFLFGMAFGHSDQTTVLSVRRHNTTLEDILVTVDVDDHRLVEMDEQMIPYGTTIGPLVEELGEGPGIFMRVPSLPDHNVCLM